MAEDEKRKKDEDKNQGRTVTLTEILHVILEYPEVVTNLNFIRVSTMPIEFRAEIILQLESVVQDGVFVSAIDI